MSSNLEIWKHRGSEKLSDLSKVTQQSIGRPWKSLLLTITCIPLSGKALALGAGDEEAELLSPDPPIPQVLEIENEDKSQPSGLLLANQFWALETGVFRDEVSTEMAAAKE